MVADGQAADQAKRDAAGAGRVDDVAGLVEHGLVGELVGMGGRHDLKVPIPAER